MKTAILTIAHGTVEQLDDLPPFLANIRRGHAAPPELVAEVRRRYEVIGGRSPLLDICRDLTKKLEAELGVPARMAMRLWPPYPRDVLAELVNEGVERVVVMPLAQHSAKIYGDSVVEAAQALSAGGARAVDVACVGNWGQSPLLTSAYAAEIATVLAGVDEALRARTTLILTAHSLPVSVVRAGDPYEAEVRASAEAVARAVGGAVPRHVVAFQSQGMGTGPGGRPIEWLGPTLEAAIQEAAARGDRCVVVAPIGFLADHVEILYDIDVEARAMAEKIGIELRRPASLNASRGLVLCLASLVRPLLAPAEGVGYARPS